MKWMQLASEPPLGHDDEYPLFNRVSIETSTVCNRRCSFCPLSKIRRAKEFMSFDLLHKIVRELANLRFEGVVQLFLLNEPLLDPFYASKIALVRHLLPKCTIYCATNGDPLRTGYVTLRELAGVGLNVLGLQVYDDPDNSDFYATLLGLNASWIRRTSNKYRRHPVGKLHVQVTDMRTGREPPSMVDSFHTRSAVVAPVRHCARPHRHLVICHDGRVPICCAANPLDLSLPSFGNVARETLRDVWNSSVAYEYRLHLQDRRRDLPGCNRCDHRMAFAHVVRRVR